MGELSNENSTFKIFSFDSNLNNQTQFELVLKNSLATINTFVVNSGIIFIGGDFVYSVNGTNVNDFLIYQIGDSPSNGSYIHFNESIYPQESSVNTMCIVDDILYIGGYFTK